MNIPPNGRAFHEATENCPELSRIRHNGLWHYVLPSGSLRVKEWGGGKCAWRTLDFPVTVPVYRPSVRQRKLRELFLDSRVWVWTMRDLGWALGLKYSRRMCGQIGKDLVAIGVCSRHHVSGLTRNGNRLPACDVFCASPEVEGRDLEYIREVYSRQAKVRRLACQQMRARG